MDKYSFDFNPKDCNKIYFKELFLLLKTINPEKEFFKRYVYFKFGNKNLKTNINLNKYTKYEYGNRLRCL
jgi:hypothetical protein